MIQRPQQQGARGKKPAMSTTPPLPPQPEGTNRSSTGSPLSPHFRKRRAIAIVPGLLVAAGIIGALYLHNEDREASPAPAAASQTATAASPGTSSTHASQAPAPPPSPAGTSTTPTPIPTLTQSVAVQAADWQDAGEGYLISWAAEASARYATAVDTGDFAGAATHCSTLQDYGGLVGDSSVARVPRPEFLAPEAVKAFDTGTSAVRLAAEACRDVFAGNELTRLAVSRQAAAIADQQLTLAYDAVDVAVTGPATAGR